MASSLDLLRGCVSELPTLRKGPHPDLKFQADSVVITIDSSERFLGAHFVIGGAAQDASRKACAALEDESPIGEFPRVDEASLAEATGELESLAIRAIFVVDSAQRPPDRLVLSSYVKLMEWARLTEDAPALDQEISRALINY